MLSTLLKLKKNVEIIPFDVASSNKYLLRTPSGNFYEISEFLYYLLCLIDSNRSYEYIARNLSEKIERKLTTQDVEDLIMKYVFPYDILELDKEGEKIFIKEKTPLWLSIPLLSQEIISPITNVLTNLFSKYLFYVSIFLFLSSSIYLLVFRTMELSINSLSIYDVITIHFVYFFSILFHEFGHSSACSKYGVIHGSIGIGFYLIFPVFFSDVSNIWKLSKNKRLMVDFAGIYFQMIYSTILFFLYVVTDSSIFYYSIVLISYSILISLNPFLKFDGYWAITDIIGVSDLRKQTKKYIQFVFNKYFLNKKQIINPLSNYSYVYRRAIGLYLLLGWLFSLFSLFVFVRHLLLFCD